MSVRDKTQRHLNRLAAAAAVASTVASSEACKNSGYGVVDPMPPPSRCSGAAASIKVTARWIDTPKGRRIELLIDQPTVGSFKLGDIANISVSGSPPDEATATATGYRLVLELKYPPYLNLSVPVTCVDRSDAGASDQVQIGLDTGDGGSVLTPNVSEY